MQVAIVTALLTCILTQLGVSYKNREEIVKNIALYSQEYNIDPKLVIAVMYRESRFKPRTKSSTSDYGLMQIHCPYKEYAPWCHNIKRLRTIKYNIKTGIYIMHLQKKKCIGKHTHKSHWIRHYNWNDKRYDKKILKTFKNIEDIANECQKN